MKVFIIQACQESQPGSRSILLRRPHTTILHATVPDGQAVRNAYIPRLAAEFSNAEGPINIDKAHKKASRAMAKSDDPLVKKQTPMLQHTMNKFLELPWSWRKSE